MYLSLPSSDVHIAVVPQAMTFFRLTSTVIEQHTVCYFLTCGYTGGRQDMNIALSGESLELDLIYFLLGP